VDLTKIDWEVMGWMHLAQDREYGWGLVNIVMKFRVPQKAGNFLIETWSLTLKEEHRLRVFQNRVLRKIFGPEREEDGSWRKLHNDELHSLYSSPNIVRVIKSRRMRWAGHVERMREGRGVYGVLVGKPERKRPLGRPTRRWKDNIKMDLRETEIDVANWNR
jgi:hypothetical protein